MRVSGRDRDPIVDSATDKRRRTAIGLRAVADLASIVEAPAPKLAIADRARRLASRRYRGPRARGATDRDLEWLADIAADRVGDLTAIVVSPAIEPAIRDSTDVLA